MLPGFRRGIRALPEQSADAVNAFIHLFEQLREEEVENDDRNEAGDEAVRTRAPNPAGAAPAVESLVTTYQPNRAAEEDALADTFHDLPGIDRLRGVIPVRAVGHVQEFGGDHPSPQHAKQVAVNREDGREQHARQKSRND